MDGHTAQVPHPAAPVGGNAGNQEGARQAWRHPAGGLQRHHAETGQQWRRQAVRPFLKQQGRHQVAGFLLASRTRLDLDVGPQPQAGQFGDGIRKRRHRLTAESLAEPASCIEPADGLPVGCRNLAMAAGRTVQVIVVQKDDVVVTRQLGVKLHPAATQLGRLAHGGKRIFRGIAAGSPVTDDPGNTMVLGRHIVSSFKAGRNRTAIIRRPGRGRKPGRIVVFQSS